MKRLIGNATCRPYQVVRWAALFLLLLLSGCAAPVTFSGRPASGSYVQKGVPDFIVAGKTTREEVHATLGTPDGMAMDRSWITYGYEQNLGGGGIEVLSFNFKSAAIVVVTMEFGRLVINFDETDVVQAARFEQKTCSSESPTGEFKDKPCLDIRGRDLPLVRGTR